MRVTFHGGPLDGCVEDSIDLSSIRATIALMPARRQFPDLSGDLTKPWLIYEKRYSTAVGDEWVQYHYKPYDIPPFVTATP